MLYVSPLHTVIDGKRGTWVAWNGDEVSLRKVAHLDVIPRYHATAHGWLFYQITSVIRDRLIQAGVLAIGTRAFTALYEFGLTPDERRRSGLSYPSLYRDRQARLKNQQTRAGIDQFIRQWREDNPPPGKRGR